MSCRALKARMHFILVILQRCTSSSFGVFHPFSPFYFCDVWSEVWSYLRPTRHAGLKAQKVSVQGCRRKAGQCTLYSCSLGTRTRWKVDFRRSSLQYCRASPTLTVIVPSTGSHGCHMPLFMASLAEVPLPAHTSRPSSPGHTKDSKIAACSAGQIVAC